MSENTPEEWRAVVGYEGLYEVSSHGRVRSLKRGGVMRPFKNWNGYYRINLTQSGRGRNHYIHRMVCFAFNGIPPLASAVAMHLNSDPTDNTAPNLKWGTQQDNIAQRDSEGKNHGRNKTKCPQGHDYSPGNTYVSGNSRKCKTCVLRRQKLSREKRRQND